MPVKAYALGDSGMAVKLQTRTGETTSFDLADNVSARIDDEDLIIKSSILEVRYPIANGVSFTMIHCEENGIEKNMANMTKFAINNGMLICEGLMYGELVRLYSLDGILISSMVADHNGRASLPFIGAHKQVIIVKTNNQFFKIIKK